MIVVFFVLFTGLYSNIASKICYDGTEDFDWWSNDILISDMMYDENFQTEDFFLYAVTPSRICPDNIFEAHGLIPDMFINDEYFEKTFYKQYTSNIVIQRFFYRAVNRALDLSHENTLRLFYILNCLLAALIVTVIFSWIYTFLSGYKCIVAAMLLAFCCPYFAMYGKNLYWLMWTLYFPMACMSVAVKNDILKEQSVLKKGMVLFGISYVSCGLKMMVCFEFMTTVMIAMVIPVFYEAFKERYNLKRFLLTMVWPVVGALLSFMTVFTIKCYMLVVQYGKEEAFNITNNNFGMRLWGTVDSGIESYGPIKVSILMMSKELISFKGMFKLSFCFSIVVCLFLLVTYLITKRKGVIWEHSYMALFWTTCISVLAPFSWFVMAAPHTTVHNLHCSINWLIPYGMLFLVLMIKTIEKLVRKMKGISSNEC